MIDEYIPAACLSDARQVIESQDPDLAQQCEQRWPGNQWKAAVKVAAQEIEHEART